MAIYANDFIFNGKSCNEFGIMLCEFDTNSSGFTTHSIGGKIDLITSKKKNKFLQLTNEYSSPLEFSISVCKVNGEEFNRNELISISKWILRKDGYKKIYFNQVDYFDIGLNVQCLSIDIISANEKDIGLTFNFITDSIFGYAKEKTVIVSVNGTATTNIYINNDEYCEIYPYIEINVTANCDFTIYNALTDTTFNVESCLADETIIYNPVTSQITTTSSNSVIDRFNMQYLSLGNKENENKNTITFTGNGTVTIKYEELKKVVL